MAAFSRFTTAISSICEQRGRSARPSSAGSPNPNPRQFSNTPPPTPPPPAEPNPYPFFERLLMVRGVIAAEGIPPARAIIIPFPVSSPERWHFYLPPDVVHSVRVFSDWEQSKVDRL